VFNGDGALLDEDEEEEEDLGMGINSSEKVSRENSILLKWYSLRSLQGVTL